MLNAKTIGKGIFLLTLIFPLFFADMGDADDPCKKDPGTTIPGEVNCDQNWKPEWDPKNPDEIPPGTSVLISVRGRGPCTWTVSGQGFSLAHAQTDEVSNLLIAAADACGTAEITVTDGCGDSDPGYVRSLCGTWCLIDECTLGGGGSVVVEIHGKYKYEDRWCVVWTANPNCEYYCASLDRCNCEARTTKPTNNETHTWCSGCVASNKTWEWMSAPCP